MNKNQEFSDELKNVLKAINAVKKIIRHKKDCYDKCANEKIKKIFITALQLELLNLYDALNDWKYNDFLVVEKNEGRMS